MALRNFSFLSDVDVLYFHALIMSYSKQAREPSMKYLLLIAWEVKNLNELFPNILWVWMYFAYAFWDCQDINHNPILNIVLNHLYQLTSKHIAHHTLGQAILWINHRGIPMMACTVLLPPEWKLELESDEDGPVLRTVSCKLPPNVDITRKKPWEAKLRVQAGDHLGATRPILLFGPKVEEADTKIPPPQTSVFSLGSPQESWREATESLSPTKPPASFKVLIH